MNLLQTIWNLLTTPNEGIIGIIFNNWGIPFVFIEVAVTVLLVTTILDLSHSKKQMISSVLILALLFGISNTLLPKPYCAYVNMFLYPITITLIFKANPIKAFLAQVAPFLITAILETVYCKIGSSLFNMSYESLVLTPLSRIIIVLLIYISIYLISLLVKYFKLNISFIENMSKKNKIILALNFIFALIVIALQFYIAMFYVSNLPFFITLLSIISLVVYFFISIFSLIKTAKLEETSQSLEEAQIYNKTLKLLHDNLRIFKHDFSNIMQSIEGYIVNKDMDGLAEYYKGIKNECNNSNNLTALSPKLINDPALYSLIASKYLSAQESDITFNVSICVNFSDIKVSPYILTRILGILLDNAIDAAKTSEEKEICFDVSGPFKNSNIKKYVISIQNTYSNKNVDLERIREKGYTSKNEEEGSHGLGLWEVNKILKRSKNLNLHTTKNDKYFKQDLEIFDN